VSYRALHTARCLSRSSREHQDVSLWCCDKTPVIVVDHDSVNNAYILPRKRLWVDSTGSYRTGTGSCELIGFLLRRGLSVLAALPFIVVVQCRSSVHRLIRAIRLPYPSPPQKNTSLHLLEVKGMGSQFGPNLLPFYMRPP